MFASSSSQLRLFSSLSSAKRSSSFEFRNISDYLEHVQKKINSSFLKISSSSNSSSLPSIFASSNSSLLPRMFASSSSQLRLFSSLSSAKRSSSFEFAALISAIHKKYITQS